MSDTIQHIAVLGSGTMGSGIAQVFGQAGFAVRLCDRDEPALVRAEQTIAHSLSKLVEKGAISSARREQTLARIHFVREIEGVADADFVVEAITEQLEAKQTLLRQLDSLTRPDVILASNTSSISITTLGTATARPDRVLGLHFMNPVPLMALVEVVRGQQTSDASMATALGLVQALGKTAVEVADYPGFIANRILMPMINEAAFALMEGVGTVEAIDTVMKLGMNHPMGPLTLADLIGLDVCVAILDVMRDGLGDPKYRACPLLRRMVAAGQLGRKAGRGFYVYA
jgi:3-hydroxybutyryl-CoA dehydrogenase